MQSIASDFELSPEIVSWINGKIEEEHIVLKVPNPRKRKLGDYKYNRITKQHQITINKDLNEGLFFLTFIHELAHKITFDNYGRAVRPHGPQWKNCFQELLKEGLEVTSKEEVKNLLYENIVKPRASIRITDKSHKGLLVSDLNTNDSFVTTSSKEVFILKEKRRTRYSCISKSSNKEYSISPDAQVTKCN